MDEHEAPTPPVTLDVVDGVARVILSRPESSNPIDVSFLNGLGHAIRVCGRRGDVRAVLIAADGPVFTVGGDRASLAEHVNDLAEQLGTTIGLYHSTLADLAALPMPVVCAVQGAVAGGGLGLLWASDVVLVSDDLRLATAFARLGLSGDGGSSWALPRLVGLRRATQLLMGGRVLGAEEAVEWGLADRVVGADALRGEAEAEARRWADGPTIAFGHMKRLLRGAWQTSWPDQLAAERAAMVACGLTEDSREGVLGLVERRPATFHGR